MGVLGLKADMGPGQLVRLVAGGRLAVLLDLLGEQPWALDRAYAQGCTPGSGMGAEPKPTSVPGAH